MMISSSTIFPMCMPSCCCVAPRLSGPHRNRSILWSQQTPSLTFSNSTASSAAFPARGPAVRQAVPVHTCVIPLPSCVASLVAGIVHTITATAYHLHLGITMMPPVTIICPCVAAARCPCLHTDSTVHNLLATTINEHVCTSVELLTLGAARCPCLHTHTVTL